MERSLKPMIDVIDVIDVIIIGAGPSGLSCGFALKRFSDLTFLIIDAGKDLFARDRYGAMDLVHGIGGAGLFSDGKFSFYPSSSALWVLRSKLYLRQAYEWYVESLDKYSKLDKTKKTIGSESGGSNGSDKTIGSESDGSNGSDKTIGSESDGSDGSDESMVPGFPDLELEPEPETKTNVTKTEPSVPGSDLTNEWFLKKYPSIYLSLGQRYGFIDSLRQGIGEEHFLLGTTVIDCQKTKGLESNDRYVVRTKNLETGETQGLECKNLIVAGGRFWPHFHNLNIRTETKQNQHLDHDLDQEPKQEPKKDLGKLNKFVRLEYGVRIQCDPRVSLFSSTTLKDPKYKYTYKTESDSKDPDSKDSDSKDSDSKDSDPGIEYRTFCCCRNGEIVVTESHGLKTCSGRSDCEPTEKSNIGFNVRILNESLGQQVKPHLFGSGETFHNVPIQSVIENNALTKYFGDPGTQYLVHGLKLLVERFPDTKDAMISGPTIEGVGGYPVTDGNLRVGGENIWVIGDACGKFRGITACMVSGYYVGLLLAEL